MGPGVADVNGAANLMGRAHSVVGPPAMARLESSIAMAAKRALFETGLELAGVRVQEFAERLLQSAEASPAARPEQLVRATMADVDGGTVALVADEPELCARRLSRAAKTVQEAADAAVHAFGLALLDAHMRQV